MQTTTNGRPVRPNISLDPARFEYQGCDECGMLSGWPANQDPLPACSYCLRAFIHPTPAHKSNTLSRRFFWSLIGGAVVLAAFCIASLNGGAR